MKISIGKDGDVGYSFDLGDVTDKKTGKIGNVYPTEYQLVEAACIYARLFCLRIRRDNRAAKKKRKMKETTKP